MYGSLEGLAVTPQDAAVGRLAWPMTQTASSVSDVDDEALKATQVDAAIELLVNNGGVWESLDE